MSNRKEKKRINALCKAANEGLAAITELAEKYPGRAEYYIVARRPNPLDTMSPMYYCYRDYVTVMPKKSTLLNDCVDGLLF